MTTVNSYPEEKDGSSTEGDPKPTKNVNGPAAAFEANGTDDYDHQIGNNLTFEELKERYDDMVTQMNSRSGPRNDDDLLQQNERLRAMVKSFQNGEYMAVSHLEEFKSLTRERLFEVRQLIANEATSKEKIFHELQNTAIDRDRYKIRFETFQRDVKRKMQAIKSEMKDAEVMEQERMTLTTTLEQTQNSLQQLRKEHEKHKKDRANMIKKHNQKKDSEKTKFLVEKRALEDEVNQMKLQVSSAANKVSELEEETQRLTDELRMKEHELETLQRSDRTQAQENNKKFLEKKKRVEQQVEAEKEVRYNLERRVNTLSEEKKRFEQDAEAFREKCDKLEVAVRRNEELVETAERERDALSGKLERSLQIQRESEKEKKEAEARARALDERNGNLHREIADLQQAMNKKVARETKLKEREQELRRREANLKSKSKQIESERKRIASNRGNRSSGNTETIRTSKNTKNRDPLFWLRALLPWPWICGVLFLLLFFGVLLRR